MKRDRETGLAEKTGSKSGSKSLSASLRKWGRDLALLWPILRPERAGSLYWRIGVCLVLLGIDSLATVGGPWALSRMVGGLADRAMVMGVMLWLLAQFLLIRFIETIASPLREWIIKPVEADWQRRVARKGLAHLLSMSMRYHLDRQTGALTRILDRGESAVGSILSLSLFNVLPNVLELVLIFAFIGRVFDWRYVLALVVGIGVYSGVSFAFTRIRMRVRRQRNTVSGQTQHLLVDTLLNVETVRAFGNAEHEIARYDRVLGDYRKMDLTLSGWIVLSNVVRGMLVLVVTGGLFALAIGDVLQHRIGVAQFVLIGTYLRGIYGAVGQLNYVSAGWRNAMVDLENYLELMRTVPEIVQPSAPVPITRRLGEGGCGARIEARGLVFGYDPKRPILDGVDFTVEPGRVLAVVGRTGSGKSTLTRLLSRAFDPQGGRIAIDGVDLRDIAASDLQAAIGIVPQDTVLFNETIGANIGYGDLGADAEAIAQAAQRAQIGPFIDGLSEGYETVVGERGLKLSGGEKQRVAIARVVLKDPRILILDEATSALDTRTEEAIQGELQALARNRTTVVIAHRLSTIRGADEILVLEAGSVAERGTHEDLLALGGIYAGMWAVQAGVVD